MNHKSLHGVPPRDDLDEQQETSEHWNIEDARLYVREQPTRCVVLLNGWVVDVTSYLREHVSHQLGPFLMAVYLMILALQPGGAVILRKYALTSEDNESKDLKLRDASWAFDGGLNNHSRAAVRQMKELRVAKIKTN